MTKYEFIKEILTEKKLAIAQREKILHLISNEILTDNSIAQRVEEIEKYLNQNHDLSLLKNNDSVTVGVGNLPRYINPFKLYEFLIEYNQNLILKHTCHKIDETDIEEINELCNMDDYDFNKHLSVIKSEYKKHSKKYSATPKTYKLIKNYLDGGGAWSTNNIVINWSCPELIDWCTIHPTIPPNLDISKMTEKFIGVLPFEIEDTVESPITNSRIEYFQDLVLHFKNLFHVRAGEQSLKDIIKRVNNQKWDEIIEINFHADQFSPSLELFTDVDKLIQAYNKIIENIIEINNKQGITPFLTLKYYIENDNVIFSMHQENAIPKKQPEDITNRLGKSTTSLINMQVNGLCNFHIRGKFGDEKYKQINLWDGKERTAIDCKPIVGIEHLLNFPRRSIH